MPIEILPARLANQIAAGEVVERPASVVKELVENSLDSGATRIEIEIEKGGRKLIRIRDNGSGIEKDELTLALSRHATSKIKNLDDLEAIMSLGFRGEALASISSVSRLTLTSRPQTQSEAWSAYAEGRDMVVNIKPAAHPVGTSVEVVDLFFNTPARRKFLRTDKTEFSHIDELIKRIALSRFDVAIVLRHNGQTIRQYQVALSPSQKEKRLAAICGRAFLRSAVEVELKHHDFFFHGWICTPEGAKSQNDTQYCFINQRIMKDKLINHAIRQAYEMTLRTDQYAAYVLFIQIDPSQVDVNVHPAKHEVRFHEPRLVHDFIFQGVADALAQAQTHSYPLTISARDSAKSINPDVEQKEQSPSISSVAFDSSSMILASSHDVKINEVQKDYHQPSSSNAQPTSLVSSSNASPKAYQDIYQRLMTMPDASKVQSQKTHTVCDAPNQADLNSNQNVYVGVAQEIGRALAVVNSHFLLLQQAQGLVLLDLRRAAYLEVLGQIVIALDGQRLHACPLLIPQILHLTPDEMTLLRSSQDLLNQFGIIIKQKSDQQMMIMAVCQILKQNNLQNFIFSLLNYLSANQAKVIAESEFAQWLATYATPNITEYTLSQAISLVSNIENSWQVKLTEHYTSLLRPVDVTAVIEAFNHE